MVNYTPSTFGVHKQRASRNIMVFVCHMASQDQVMKA